MPSICRENVALDSITRIKSEKTFSSRHLLGQELAINDRGSSEVYYRNSSVAIPFQWESQPGTPKVKSRDSNIPPLTPPPSLNSRSITRKSEKFKHSKSIFSCLPKKTLIQKSSSTTSTSSSPWSSHSVSSSPFGDPNESKQYTVESPRKSFDLRYDSGMKVKKNGKSRGCFSSIIIKIFLGESAA
ncbi:hypothetical protein BUALT_Bualt13G0099600 [Buddleja alternifolia]|uniref:Uncharacterized protein n=1 Tax=Buddleja alternifolia TaxID=168488 RepID=A0AAV6WX73_9LAMI|nr:hypothetical protein BUALT_Bualt13G0099600 [Buddleja alternifolia]